METTKRKLVTFDSEGRQGMIFSFENMKLLGRCNVNGIGTRLNCIMLYSSKDGNIGTIERISWKLESFCLETKDFLVPINNFYKKQTFCELFLI